MLYRPTIAGSDVGYVVYVHGGGFALFDADGHDRAARRLANRSRLPVLSIDYRLAPHHRFPAQLDDIAAVLNWLDARGPSVGLRGRAFLQGDSAGGNLALVTALRNPGHFSALVLIYPFLDPTAGFDSYQNAVPGGSAADATVFWDQYTSSAADLVNPDVAPLERRRGETRPETVQQYGERSRYHDVREHRCPLFRVGLGTVDAPSTSLASWLSTSPPRGRSRPWTRLAHGRPTSAGLLTPINFPLPAHASDQGKPRKSSGSQGDDVVPSRRCTGFRREEGPQLPRRHRGPRCQRIGAPDP